MQDFRYEQTNKTLSAFTDFGHHLWHFLQTQSVIYQWKLTGLAYVNQSDFLLWHIIKLMLYDLVKSGTLMHSHALFSHQLTGNVCTKTTDSLGLCSGICKLFEIDEIVFVCVCVCFCCCYCCFAAISALVFSLSLFLSSF